METKGILPEAEAANMIVDLKPQTLAKWRLRHKGPAYLKLGGKIRYRVIDIQEWLRRDPPRYAIGGWAWMYRSIRELRTLRINMQ